MTNHNEIVSKVREIARDNLRLKRINEIRTSIMVANGDKDSVLKRIESCKLEIATIEFEKVNLATDHPKYAQLTENMDKTIEKYNEVIKEAQATVERYDEQLANLSKKIEETTDGTYKVSKDEMETLADRLINEISTKAVSDVEVEA